MQFEVSGRFVSKLFNCEQTSCKDDCILQELYKR
jgi:hypothetical protein